MVKNELRRTISFGKIGWDSARNINEIEVEMHVREKDEGVVFSACVNVWNSRHTDIVAGGQCFDEVKKRMRSNPVFNEIYGLWQRNHLNDMHPGTPAQEIALEVARDKGEDVSDYTLQCEYLKKIGLYEMPWNGENYKYGHGWLYRPIDEEDMKLIEKYTGYTSSANNASGK